VGSSGSYQLSSLITVEVKEFGLQFCLWGVDYSNTILQVEEAEKQVESLIEPLTEEAKPMPKEAKLVPKDANGQ
jgi:hypothetical protein